MGLRETTMETAAVESVLKRAQIAGILERTCQERELTDAQFELALVSRCTLRGDKGCDDVGSSDVRANAAA
jgi:hypothetical protein